MFEENFTKNNAAAKKRADQAPRLGKNFLFLKNTFFGGRKLRSEREI